MIKFTNNVMIDRRPADVLAFLADLENLPRWNYAIAQTRKITTGPVRPGSRYRQTRTIPARSEETFEVTGYQPDRGLSIRGVLWRFPAEVSYVLDPAGDGTVVTNTVELRPPGPLGVIASLATARVKAAVAANLDVLKRILEQDGRSDGGRAPASPYAA